jgi:small conductance mechanosensitive channel
MENTIEQLRPIITMYGLKVIGAIAILIVGRIVAGLIRVGVRKVMNRANVDPSIVSFVCSLAYVAIIVFTVLAALSNFGIETTSFIAVLGAAGFAIGFALQGSLANFAAGILTLVLRPYKVGDWVEAAGVAGAVKEITLFNTIVHTGDNVRVLVPNGQIFGSVIKNYTANDTRRIDLVIGIGYDSSIKKARELLIEIIDADDRILRDPVPVIGVHELGDSSVNFVVRPWVKRTDYWAVRWDLHETIKETFDAHRIEIPFPQRRVHMVSSGS